MKSIKRNGKRYSNTTKKTMKKCSKIPAEFKNITAIVSTQDVKKNLQYLKKKSGTDVMPILKANAYGHGIVEMAKICRRLHVKHIGVATIGEAMQLRNSGDKGRILAWLYDVHSDQVRDAVAQNIDIAIFNEAHIPIISKSLPKHSVANVHLFVDTGIDRNGVPHAEAIDAAIKLSNDPKFKLVGLMTHLCCAETKDNAITNKQFRLFRKLRQDLLDRNIDPELVHVSATNGILNYDNSDFNLSRSGAGFYGIEENKHLTPILSLSSIIIQLKNIPKGEGIGYDRKYITHANKFIGIVPIGYADLIPLTPSEKLCVFVNGTKRKVLGLESMDQIVIEAKKGDKMGDKVHLFGDNKRGNNQSLHDFAREGSTTPFNIITRMGERVNIKYV
uniref:Alanine racemase C-terminal domain-containing protein n=1 Tax=viral metagenome TaxID=1070528 RepID=A0A6C0I699_9ZZZZ